MCLYCIKYKNINNLFYNINEIGGFVMAKWLEKLFKSNKKQEEIVSEEVIVENKTVKITNLTQYRLELDEGTTDFDFSELDVTYEDIQNINLENLNLNINLREVFVPFNGSCKHGNIILPFVFNAYRGDYFLKLQNSRLGGNNVTGDLTLFEGNSHTRPVYVWYSEETFDDNYKSQYPQFFLSKDAPEELREKYYNPKIIYEEVVDPVAVIHDLEEKNKKVKSLVRQTLTLDEYLKYYKFLKGKYLGNFSISKQDLLQIEIIEKYGIEQRDAILEHINNMMNNINQTADCENYTINEADDKGVTLTLKLKFKK